MATTTTPSKSKKPMTREEAAKASKARWGYALGKNLPEQPGTKKKSVIPDHVREKTQKLLEQQKRGQ